MPNRMNKPKNQQSYIKIATPTRTTTMPAMPACFWEAEPSKSSSSSGYDTPWTGRPLGLGTDGTKGGVPAGWATGPGCFGEGASPASGTRTIFTLAIPARGAQGYLPLISSGSPTSTISPGGWIIGPGASRYSPCGCTTGPGTC